MGRFRFEDDHRYMMPAHFGGLKHVTTTTTYRDVTSLVTISPPSPPPTIL